MVKRSLYPGALLNKLVEQEDKFFENFAKDYLIYLGNPKPTPIHIKEMKSILCETEVKRVVTLDGRLSFQEKKCLFLSGKGKSIKEIAKILSISFPTVREYRNKAIKKLGASNITAAVALGVKYNTIDLYEIV